MTKFRRNSFVDSGSWIRCGYCGHKLGRSVVCTDEDGCAIEIKCHSCKNISVCHVNKRRVRKERGDV